MTQELRQFFKKLLDLREGAENKQIIIQNIKDESDVSSARFWTLVFAIGVASVGLNINSTPVIIGAMLISPIMSPVVSMGLALSIYDWGLMRRAFRSLLVLTTISIFISAIYFALTPITNAQSELLARTQPTIFDVLIAIFGGMAGFIGISRARQSNIIPGVAIATALMPPLCTVGYGIGTMQPVFIFGAFYLFLINCIFICLSALVVATYMKLPKHEYPDIEKKKRVNRIITAIIVVIVTPAVYFAYTFVQQNNFNQHAAAYIKNVFENDGHVVIYKNISYSPTKQVIEVAFLSEHFTDQQVRDFNSRLRDYDLSETELKIRQDGFALTEEDWQSVLSEIKNDDEKVKMLENRLESEKASFESPVRVTAEAKLINSKIDKIAIGSLDTNTDDPEKQLVKTVAIVYSLTDGEAMTVEESQVVSDWLKTRLQNDDLLIYFMPEIIKTAEEVSSTILTTPSN